MTSSGNEVAYYLNHEKDFLCKDLTVSTINGGAIPTTETASNVGAGAGVFKAKVANDFQFKTIIGGTNITVTNNANDLTLSTAGEANTTSNSGVTTYGLAQTKVGVNLPFKSLTSTGAVVLTSNANDVQISTTAEANTASNVGAGTGTVFKQKTGADFEFKTIIAGTRITVTNNASDITLATTAEINTASNVGAGTGTLFKQKTSSDLEFKSLVAGTGIALTNNTSDVTIALNASLDTLTDTVITGPATNQVVLYNGTNWVNTTIINTATTNGGTGSSAVNGSMSSNHTFNSFEFGAVNFFSVKFDWSGAVGGLTSSVNIPVQNKTGNFGSSRPTMGAGTWRGTAGVITSAWLTTVSGTTNMKVEWISSEATGQVQFIMMDAA